MICKCDSMGGQSFSEVRKVITGKEARVASSVQQ